MSSAHRRQIRERVECWKLAEEQWRQEQGAREAQWPITDDDLWKDTEEDEIDQAFFCEVCREPIDWEGTCIGCEL